MEHGLTMQFNFCNSIFICSEILTNGLYFLTLLSYSINVIEHNDDEKLSLF